MKRFFYSGCSFTSYSYPTWADIIAYDLVTQGKIDRAFNMGRAGACNEYIASSLIMANQQAKITENDFVGVGWTSLWRHSLINDHDHDPNDRIEFRDWQTFGNVANNLMWNRLPNHLDFINTYPYLLNRLSNYYNSIHNMFDLNYEVRMFGIENGKFELEDLGISNLHLKNYLSDTYLKHLSVTEWFTPGQCKKQDVFFSSHPSISDHLEMAKKVTDLHPDTISEIDKLDAELNQIMTHFLDSLPNHDEQHIKHLGNTHIHAWRLKLHENPGWDSVFSFSHTHNDLEKDTLPF